MTTTTETTYYLIERGGDSCEVWGPYPTLAVAKKAAGIRYLIVAGDLSGRKRIGKEEARALIRTGSLRIADGTGVDGF